MSGFTDAQELVVLDATFTAGDYIGFSISGSAETSVLGRAAITWSAAASGQKKNASGITTGEVTGAGGNIGYFAIFDAGTGGNQLTDWTALTTARDVVAGDKLDIAADGIVLTLE